MQDLRLTSEGLAYPCPRRSRLVLTQRRPKIRIRQYRIKLKARFLILHELPARLLLLRLRRSIYHDRKQAGLRAAWRWRILDAVPGQLDRLVVPPFCRDLEWGAGFDVENGGGGGSEYDPFDGGLFGGGAEGIEGSLDGFGDDGFGVTGEG